MADAVTAAGETPFDVQIGTGNAAGTALKASFVADADPVGFQTVNIRGAKMKAGLVFAIFQTFCTIDYFQMAFFIHSKAV
jgi:hypothetical protein